MFKKRFLTSMVLIAIALWGVFYAPRVIFAAGVFAIIVIAATEWADLVGVKKLHWLLLYATLIITLILFLPESLYLPVLLLTCVLWLCAFIGILFYPSRQRIWLRQGLMLVMGVFFFFSLAISLLLLKRLAINQTVFWLLYLLLIVWLADTGAYLVGKLWGKRKFVPLLSPKKTMLGVVGGFFAVLIVGLAGGLWLGLATFYEWFIWLGFAMVLTAISMVGDLFISMLKRMHNVKDTGAILPGHGGILDRFDSLLATAPYYVVLLIVTKIITL